MKKFFSGSNKANQCQCTTTAGKQCTKTRANGSEYCSQHLKCDHPWHVKVAPAPVYVPPAPVYVPPPVQAPPMTSSHAVITFNDAIKPEIREKVLSAPKFLSWFNQLYSNPAVKVSNVNCRDVYMFGPNVGFVFINSTVKLNDNPSANLPGVVFLRGNAVSVLVILEEQETGQLWALQVRQFRVPIGDYIIESVAGMMDTSNNFKYVAAQELREETGLTLPAGTDFTYLGEFYPSPGGSDEKIEYYFVKLIVPKSNLHKLISKTHGLQEHGEYIGLVLFSLPELRNSSTDPKTLLAYYKAVEKGLL